MPSRVVNAAEIHNFLHQVQWERGPGLWYRPSEASGLLDAYPGPFYRPSLILSEPRAPPQPRTERDMASLASSATPLSATFDMLDSQSAYSASTAPPRRGPEPLHRQQRAPVPDFAVSWLPCEFRKLSGCGARFALDQVEPWIEHMAGEHLRGILPEYCICWFCDHAKFRAASGQLQDRGAAYRSRMYHIASHFGAGSTAADVRWDFHFLDHVHVYGLISDHVFQWAAQQSEVPMPRDMTFVSPRAAAIRPRGEEGEEDYGERRRRHARRPSPPGAPGAPHTRRVAE